MKKEKQEKQAISKAKIVMGLVAILLLLALLATVSVVVVKNKQQDDLNSNTNVTGEIFTVAFESNGGSAVDSLVGIAKGNKIVKPASPTKPNFSFVGWYKDAELLTEYIFETDVVNTNFTLYAKWEDKAAHVHAYGEWVITTPATCTTAGEKTKTCACGEVITEVVPATGHSYSDWVITTPATCTTAGEMTRTCSVCGSVEKGVIPATGIHTYGDWDITTPATCTTAGERTRTCSVCGVVEKGVIPELGHTYGKWTIKTPATCSTAGERTRTCSVCGDVEKGAIPATGIHTYGDWDITKPATCTTAGKKTKTCACGETVTEDIPARGHTYGEWVETETEGSRECTVCHHKEVVTYTVGLQYGDVRVNGNLLHMVTGRGTASGAVYIPKTHDGKPVGGIDEGVFRDCSSLVSITIPSSVTIIKGGNDWNSGAFFRCANLTTVTFEAGSLLASIGQSSFDGCTSLAAITIPSSVISIGSRAFAYCTSLAAITIPNRVTSIGSGAFQGCTALASIEVDLANANYQSIDGNLYNKAGTTLVLYAPGKTETSFNVPSSVTSILGSDAYGGGAFSGCKNLATVTFAAGSLLASIGDGAFGGCTALASITIPSSVTSIGDKAFLGCTNLATVTFAEGSQLTSIGSSAFSGCSSLASITIPRCVTSIGGGAFSDCTNLTTVTFAAGSKLTSIGNSAFSGCTSLASITIPSGVTSIGEGGRYSGSVFYNCTNLATVTFEAGSKLTSIGDRAFDGCTVLTSITIPSSVTSIGQYAFRGCTKLATVTFAEGSQLARIGGYAFNGCTSLAAITIPSSVTRIWERAFSDCTALTIYAEAAQPSGWHSNWNYSNCLVVWNCKTSDVADDGYIHTIQDGVCYGIKNGEAEVIKQTRTITTANIVASITYKGAIYAVTSIGYEAFYGCTSLASVTIPISVTSIKERAFCGWVCSSLTIYAEAAWQPSGWEKDWNKIDNNTGSVPVKWAQNNITTNVDFDYTAHNNQAYLTKYKGSSLAVVVPEAIDGKPVVFVGEIFVGAQITSISLPSGVTSILGGSKYDGGAFGGCTNLVTVTFEAGSQLTHIESYAFNRCTSLTSIIIPSSVTSIGSSAFDGCTSLTNITIPSSVTSIEGGAFYGCTSLAICAEVAAQSSGWDRYWNIIDNNNGRAPVKWAQNNITTNVDFDYTVHNNQVYLTKYKGSSLAVVVPEAIDGKPVVFVGEIFAGTQITSISLPSGVTRIVDKAFYACTKLATVTFAAGSKLTSIGDYAFSGCTSLTSITLPSSVTSIGWGAFQGCTSLTNITIPSSVTSIGCLAFDGCSALTIYAEVAGPLSWWNSKWNYSGCPVYWYRETAPTGTPATGSGYWHYVGGVPTKW